MKRNLRNTSRIVFFTGIALAALGVAGFFISMGLGLIGLLALATFDMVTSAAMGVVFIALAPTILGGVCYLFTDDY